MGKEQKVVYSIDLLKVEIDKIVNKQMLRGNLWREIDNEFERKGLNKNSLRLLLDDDKQTADDLNDYELIAFSKIAYEKLKWKELNPSRYFGDLTMINYNNYYGETDKIIDTVELRNFIRIDDFNYRGQITYKQIYDYVNSKLLIYSHDAQRSPKYRKIGSKEGKSQMLKTINVNETVVEEICNSILEGNFEDTEIILNCEIVKGKTQQFIFTPKYKNILGDIIIKPNYNMDDKTTTWINVADGWHRRNAIVLAVSRHYEKTGEWLEGSIGVRLVRANKERAKRIVHQTFLRSSDEMEWVNALAENDYTVFVDMVVKESKRLTIGNTLEEAEINKKLTSKSLLVDITKKTNIAVNDTSDATFTSIEMAKRFDLMYDYSAKKGVLLNPYKVGAYFYIAHKIEDVSKLIRLIELLEDNEEFITICKKHTGINNFVNLIEEVIVNV